MSYFYYLIIKSKTWLKKVIQTNQVITHVTVYRFVGVDKKTK